jgi:signal transduction histidine kinase
MLRRQRTPEEYRAALEAIDRNIDVMTRTVEALVAAARHEAGLTRTTSDLRTAVTTAVEGARPAVAQPSLHLTLPPEPVRVTAEQELLTRIVQPLVDNACRYGQSMVTVEVLRNGSVALVNVFDDGPGVRDDESEHIFEPGWRGRAAAKTIEGAGLGLSLARRLARSAGGDITVSASSAGGRFSLWLPLSR